MKNSRAILMRFKVIPKLMFVLALFILILMMSGSSATAAPSLQQSDGTPNRELIVVRAPGTIIHDIRTPFDWYVPQGYPIGYPQHPKSEYYHTAPNDCGPSSVAMAIRYLSVGADVPRPDEVRATVSSLAGQKQNTFASDLVSMLSAYGVTGVSTITFGSTVTDTIINSVMNN